MVILLFPNLHTPDLPFSMCCSSTSQCRCRGPSSDRKARTGPTSDAVSIIIYVNLGKMQSFGRHDLRNVAIIKSLPVQQTVFVYLVGCWKRVNSAHATLIKKVKRVPLQVIPTVLIHMAYSGISAHGDSTSAECVGETA